MSASRWEEQGTLLSTVTGCDDRPTT